MSCVTRFPKRGPLLQSDTEFLCTLLSLLPGRETSFELVVFSKGQVIEEDSSLP